MHGVQLCMHSSSAYFFSEPDSGYYNRRLDQRGWGEKCPEYRPNTETCWEKAPSFHFGTRQLDSLRNKNNNNKERK